MSVIQSTQPELRYVKRQNLDNEARIVGNYYRDLIRSYGIDCIYNKLDISEFSNFKNIVDRNTILKQAYGYNISPDYSMSAHMLTYMEVENDIFQLNKFGLNPNADVNFYFETNDFACALATKVGTYKEYPVKETEIECEVPECVSDFIICGYEEDGSPKKQYLSSSVFPYELGLGYNEGYIAENLSGKLYVAIDGYEVGKETTVVCHPYEHTDFSIKFDSNNDLYKSLKHVIENDDYVETLLFLTFTVNRVLVSAGSLWHPEPVYKYILSGKLHGKVLFYDIQELGKYAEKIHPAVGDIVTIDFPDESSRERYEITECYDKQLTQDGISPLLHKYIWKCKARRYASSYEDVPSNEADERMQEKSDFQAAVNEEVAKQVSFYDDSQDATYGGYELERESVKNYDKQDVRNMPHARYEHLQEGQLIDIHVFDCGSKLCTDGYVLVFIAADGNAYAVNSLDRELAVKDAVFECGIKWLKATKNQVRFINIEGTSFQLTSTDECANAEELNLDSIYDTTIDAASNRKQNGSFIQFNGCKTYLFATQDHLYVKLDNAQKAHMLV